MIDDKMKEKEKEFEKQLKAVANRRRLAILKYLKKNNEAPVTEIANAIDLSFKATSKHLGILAVLDIVQKEQRSLQVFYRLVGVYPPAITAIIKLL